jgi:hypothetical protein
MPRKPAPPLTVDAVRKELEKMPADHWSRGEASFEGPVRALCELSPRDAPKIIERVLRADAPGVLADVLRADPALLRELVRFLDTKAPKRRDLRDALAMFDEAQCMHPNAFSDFVPKQTGRGRRTNLFGLQRDALILKMVEDIRASLAAGEPAPGAFFRSAYRTQAMAIKKRGAALARLKGNVWAKEYAKARKDFATEIVLRAAVVYLEAEGSPHTREASTQLLGRLKKSRRSLGLWLARAHTT